MMHEFIESNYQNACKRDQSFHKDEKMLDAIRGRRFDNSAVQDWMRSYGLFQGIKSECRTRIVEVYTTTIFDLTSGITSPTECQIKSHMEHLLSTFHEVVPRKWISAASKLLWCSYPGDIVIYDAFVHRSLIVLQGVTPYLAKMPRLGNCPRLKKSEDIPNIADFYMQYQNMVKEIL